LYPEFCQHGHVTPRIAKEEPRTRLPPRSNYERSFKPGDQTCYRGKTGFFEMFFKTKLSPEDPFEASALGHPSFPFFKPANRNH
jgi:hypothetical protein